MLKMMHRGEGVMKRMYSNGGVGGGVDGEGGRKEEAAEHVCW